ncbi:MAG: lytic transglycosylase domain-containing protein [Saprospiraceae bacterium]|nr:lytic transglycosylase domain-containing protein [Saprospiraceae bacterium]
MKTANCPMIKVPALLQAWLVFFIVLFSQSLWANFIPDAAALTALNVLVDDVDDENVAKYIDAFLKHPETTEELLSRGNIYLPLIEKELTIQGLPSALKVLPLIESRFDPLAVSRVGAAGLWQFMIPTARELGLRINSLLDERRDPAKATRAALSYIQFLYSKYEDWSLVFAAYNSGPGTVNKAIRMAGGSKDFESIKGFLPKQTQQYIPKYLAAQYIVEYYRDLGLKPSYPDLDMQWTSSIHMTHSMKLKDISKVVQIPVEIIMSLNPSLNKEYVPQLAQGYDLVLPKRVIPGFQYYLDTKEPAELNLVYRTMEMMVDHKQSIFELAGNLKVDPYLLRAWNELKGEVIQAGDRIIIHELYDPSQVFAEEVKLVPFAKKQESVSLLPAQIDYQRMLYQFFLREKERQEEILSWQLHQM